MRITRVGRRTDDRRSINPPDPKSEVRVCVQSDSLSKTYKTRNTVAAMSVGTTVPSVNPTGEIASIKMPVAIALKGSASRRPASVRISESLAAA